MSQFQKGQSGNPSGRPPGRSLQSRLREAVDGRFDELVGVLVNAAAGGDMAAMTLLMNRIVPALRPVQDPSPFSLTGDTLTEQAYGVLASVASGEISVQDGTALLTAVGGVVRVQDAEILAKQIDLIRLQLEAADDRKRGQRR
jgi:hypothetical protein